MQIAREFGLTKSYAWRVLMGERPHPLRAQILARQAYLLELAAAKSANERTLSELKKHED